MRCRSILALFFISGLGVQPAVAQTSSVEEAESSRIAVLSSSENNTELKANSEASIKVDQQELSEQREAVEEQVREEQRATASQVQQPQSANQWLAELQYNAYIDFYSRFVPTVPGVSEEEKKRVSKSLARFILIGIDGLILQAFALDDAPKSGRGADVAENGDDGHRVGARRAVLLVVRVPGRPRMPEIVFAVVAGAGLGAGLVGKLMGFYPIEAAITAGLCMANMGGTGDVAVLSAANGIAVRG